MATLARELRKELENTVVKARIEAEVGARKALEEYAVHERVAYEFMEKQPARLVLRERLRARGAQAGDTLHKDGSQTLQHLCAEFAYEHWHRMLFARFLAENGLLIQPGSEMPISLDECRELAKDENKDWLSLASEYAQRMLPAIFRADDPVLDLTLPMESRNKLETWLKDLPTEVFLADDSLGWVYQFWQAKKKDEVNKSEIRIGADEIAPVTQLFTEDYMVLFLLHNTLGAWWAAKRKTEGKPYDLAGYEWTYLRFKEDGSPAAGGFEGWPTLARDLKLLDPCMGSGHFLVFALPILVGFRMEEEGLSTRDAVTAVLRDNLFGLEIDPRCTQIAAFNLALTAWKMGGGNFQLPSLNLACSGLGINAKEEDWVKLAGNDPLLRETMKELYQLFKQAPILGSLIDPKRVGGHLFAANFEKARPFLEKALRLGHKDGTEAELAVTAKGLLAAADMLSSVFTVIVTNVPYLGRGKQCDNLKSYCEEIYADSKADLATSMLERCRQFLQKGGALGAVSTQTWFYQVGYKKFRKKILTGAEWNIVVRLGEYGFESPQAAGAFTVLLCLTNSKPDPSHVLKALDVSGFRTPAEKSESMTKAELSTMLQCDQLLTPEHRIILQPASVKKRLNEYAFSVEGLSTGDSERYLLNFCEVPSTGTIWDFFQRSPDSDAPYSGMSGILRWEKAQGPLADSDQARIQGQNAWGKRGVLVNLMRHLNVSLTVGAKHDKITAVVVPKEHAWLPAIWSYCSSPQFHDEVRILNPALQPGTATLVKVPFDAAYWNKVASENFPAGVPSPYSNDPCNWLFSGNPQGAEQPLQVAVARLLGYRWPRQTGSSFPDCPALGDDGLEGFAADDGIVCLPALQGKPSAADRLSALLAAAFGKDWPGNQQELLKQAGGKSTTLEDWLRDEFFAQHCDVFHRRPFIWHVWDGLDRGFHALVNYHRLAAPKGEAKRTLEKLTYTYLGEWIERQRNQQKQGVAGSDARLASAVHLQEELKRVLEGQPPYDIFVRWKPLHEQAIGWEPDINDGVRLNIRPFITARPLTAKVRNACILRVRPALKWTRGDGTEAHCEKQDFPWFWSWDEQADNFIGGAKFDGNRWNDLHYSLEMKRKARAQQESKDQKGQHA